MGDVQDVLSVALGGMPLTTTVEGLERYTVNLRYDRDFRSDLRALREDIVIPTATGAQVPLGQLAKLKVVDAPMGIKSEGAVPNAWIYVDVRGIDVGTYVQNAMRTVNAAIADGKIKLPSGYNIFWSGEYESMVRARERLLVVVPLTLLIIILIIYLNTKSLIKTAIVMLAVPFSLVGAIWALYLFDYNLSVAVWVGIIALAGLGRGDWRRDAALPRSRLRRMEEEGFAHEPCRVAGCDLSRRSETRPSQSHDRVRHHRRSGADPLESRDRRGCDETHCHAHGRRRDHFDADGAAGLSGDLLLVAFADVPASKRSTHPGSGPTGAG